MWTSEQITCQMDLWRDNIPFMKRHNSWVLQNDIVLSIRPQICPVCLGSGHDLPILSTPIKSGHWKMATKKGEPPQEIAFRPETSKLVQKDTMFSEGWWEIKEPQMDSLSSFQICPGLLTGTAAYLLIHGLKFDRRSRQSIFSSLINSSVHFFPKLETRWK